MAQGELKPLDWAAGVELAGGNTELAQDLLGMLLAEAPKMLAQLEQIQEQDDIKALWNDAHKLHGSTAYCGVPALRAESAALEQAIKSNNAEDARACLDAVRKAIDDLNAAAAQHPAP